MLKRNGRSPTRRDIRFYQEDREFTDRFLTEIKILLAQYLIEAAPDPADMHEATDLVLVGQRIPVACRIRKHDYYQRYGSQFTIRSYRASGQTTELDKILAGHARYLFYGFATADEQHLYAARLLDLEVFRVDFTNHLRALTRQHQHNAQNGQGNGKHPRHLHDTGLRYVEKFNDDGSSGFTSFETFTFPSRDRLVVRSWPDPYPDPDAQGIPWHTLSYTQTLFPFDCLSDVENT